MPSRKPTKDQRAKDEVAAAAREKAAKVRAPRRPKLASSKTLTDREVIALLEKRIEKLEKEAAANYKELYERGSKDKPSIMGALNDLHTALDRTHYNPFRKEYYNDWHEYKLHKVGSMIYLIQEREDGGGHYYIADGDGCTGGSLLSGDKWLAKGHWKKHH